MITTGVAAAGGDLLSRVSAVAEQDPERPAVDYLDDRGGLVEGQTRSYAELFRDFSAVAGDLASRHSRGDRVLILTAPGLPFLQSFLGCLGAGMVAVPAPLPGDEKGMDRLGRIVSDAEAVEILTTEDLREFVSDWVASSGLATPPVVTAVDRIDPDGPPAGPYTPDADALAFLQYTSGSTSEPKGVMVTLGNLSHNLEVIHRACRMEEGSTIIGWLPHFHDMGLIGQVLYPLSQGYRGVHMSPTTFLKRPHVWIRALSDFGATGTVAPNFAFDMCVRRISDTQLEGVDLSRLRTLLNGSEPIRVETLRAFAARFHPFGLDPAAISPCYGLAESTLMVSSDDPEPFHELEVDAAELTAHRISPPSDRPARILVSSGRPGDLDVAVVDPVLGLRLGEAEVGEIQIRGASVAAGYWANPEVTAEVFDQTVEGVSGFMRTGDLGALVDGRLYVTGRLGDMIILNGRNIYPHDLEQTSREAHPALTGGLAAVFAVGENDDRVVVVQEVVDDAVPADDLRGAIRDQVRGTHEVTLSDVTLVPRKTVARTTSGKIRRAEMRERYLSGEFGTEELGTGEFNAGDFNTVEAPAASR